MTVPRAVLFDLDDTLTDRRLSIERFATVFHEAFGDALADTTDAALAVEIRRADGKGYRARPDVAADLAVSLPWRASPGAATLLAYWEEWFARSATLSDGALAVLEALRARGLLLGIVTNGATLRQNAKIDVLDLRRFVGPIVVSETVGVNKPDRRIFDVALAALGVAPGEAWFVGDNPVNDVLGAESAGLTGVWYRNDHVWPSEHPMPARVVDALPELLNLLPRDGAAAR